MKLKTVTVFFVLLAVGFVPIATATSAFAQAVANTTSTTASLQALQQRQQELNAEKQKILLQQQSLEAQAKQIQHEAAIAAAKAAQEHRDILYTAGIVKPSLSSARYDALKNCNPDQTMPVADFADSKYINWWKTYLTDFHCGHVVQQFSNNNTALREFTLIANDNGGLGQYIKISKNSTDPVLFPAWSFNNTVPGPTMRMTQGDHIRITMINSNESKFPHSFHTHSIHAGIMDGVSGPGGAIPPGHSFTYEFVAQPYGVYPYHCHMEPVQYHIMRGLYGMMIIDPPTPRPQAKELVMMMNGFSFNAINLVNPNSDAPPSFVPPNAQQLKIATADFPLKNDDKNNGDNNNDKATGAAGTKGADAKKQEQLQQQQQQAEDQKQKIKDEAFSPGGGEEAADNQFYAVNSMAFGYIGKDAIGLKTNEPVRIYLANIVEFDPVNSFHLHGNMFNYYPSGTSTEPDYLNDIVVFGQGDRAILEFKSPMAGDFMFHAHINRFTNLGWMGFFHVQKAVAEQQQAVTNDGTTVDSHSGNTHGTPMSKVIPIAPQQHSKKLTKQQINDMEPCC